jgi:hypothetical protein
MAKITVPAGVRTALGTQLVALFTEIETIAKAGTEVTPTLMVEGGVGITKGMKDVIADFVADCEDGT